MKKLFARLAVAFCCATAALRGQSTFTNATLNGVLTINASQIQGSSYIPPAMLGTGIPSSSTVLYGDGAWRANTQQIPSYAGLAGYVLSNTGTSLVWLNSGGLGVSLQQSFTQANSFVAGQPVVILNTGVVAPSVSSTTFSSAVAFGVIQSAGLSSTGFTVVTHGQCVVTGGTFTPGAPYYVPTSATVVTSIAPSSNGFFLTPIAIALNSTTLIVNPQTPSTIGGDITGNSFLATGTFGGSYSAGAVVDYATGNGRISVGSGAAITFYTGGVGTTAMAQLSPTGFTDYGTLTVSGSGAVNLGSGTTTVGGLLIPSGGFGGSLPTPSANGQFYIGISGSGGAQITGKGSSQDVTIYNNALSTAAYVPTGTTNWHVAGNLITDGSSTLTGYLAASGGLTAGGTGGVGGNPLTVQYAPTSGAGFTVQPNATAANGTTLLFGNYNISGYEPGIIVASTLTFQTNVANTALTLDTSQRLIHAAGDVSNPVSLTAASTININWALGNTYSVTLNQNTTFTFSNTSSGQVITIAVTNNSSYTLAWPTIKWPGASTPVLTTSAHTDVFTIIDIGGTYFGSAVQNF